MSTTTTKRLVAAAAVGAALAAIGAPGAAAIGVGRGAVEGVPVQAPATSAPSESSGFSWGDAAVGGIVGAGLLAGLARLAPRARGGREAHAPSASL
jgi:hypothetical protein